MTTSKFHSSSASPAFPFMLPSPNDGETDAKQKQQEEDKQNCNKYVNSGLTRNVTVQFLMERLMNMGCAPPKGFISCIDCGDKQAGAGFGVVEETIIPPSTAIKDKDKYSRQANDRLKRQCDNTATLQDLQDQIKAQNEGKAKLRLLPEIFLCQNHLVNEEHAHQSMVHELIHAIDLCRTKMDPINNCIHMACTEIRAENLSGECGAVRELVNGRTAVGTFKGHGAKCVKRRAILSVEANPNCKERANEYVDAAFERCFRDTFPFERHPNLR
jgi:hypothetical protein